MGAKQYTIPLWKSTANRKIYNNTFLQTYHYCGAGKLSGLLMFLRPNLKTKAVEMKNQKCVDIGFK